MIHKMLLDLPTQIEAERIYLRKYQAGDGSWYFVMGQRNRNHLLRYEADNAARSLESEPQAEAVMERFAAEWDEHNCFFMGAFDKQSDEFLAQIYVGPVSWDLPEFEIGFFVDVDHEGQGYVTEAIRSVLGFIFEHLNAHRVRMQCDDTNDRSLRVAERCGFLREGHFRENKRNADGTLSGTLWFGLLRGEYERIEKNK